MMRVVFCLFVFCATLYPSAAQAVYLQTIDFNGKSGWITATASGERTFENPEEVDSLPDTFSLKNPEQSDTAFRLVDGSIVSDTTGATIKPSPDEAKDSLLNQAKNEWGMNRGEVRSLIKTYAIYEYIDGGNFSEAKAEATDAFSNNDITESQRDWIHDLLDGKV